MAGEQLLKIMNSRGGKANEFSDLVFGKVISTSPLKIQYDQKMILPEGMLTLGHHVTKYSVDVSFADPNPNYDKDDPESQSSITTSKTVTVDESLKVGDGVAMIRRDGGQSFYVLEKV